MNWKSTAAVSGATLLAGWLGWTPSQNASGTAGAAATPRDASPVVGVDIQEQATRLQTRVRAELEYHDPTRNPFRFAVRTMPVAKPMPATQHQSAPLAVAVPFAELRPYTLSGIATDAADGELSRTAIVSSPSDVLFIRPGDRLGSYTVTRIDDEGLQLTGPDGPVRLELAKP